MNWKILESETVYKNHYWQVYKDKVELPNGKPGHWSWVKGQDFVSVIPFVDQQHIILVELYRHPVKRRSWELSMGYIEPGETPQKAAIRELEEETGWKAGQVKLVGKADVANHLTNQCFSVFTAHDLTKGVLNLEDAEADMINKIFHLEEVWEMIRQGKNYGFSHDYISNNV